MVEKEKTRLRYDDAVVSTGRHTFERMDGTGQGEREGAEEVKAKKKGGSARQWRVSEAAAAAAAVGSGQKMKEREEPVECSCASQTRTLHSQTRTRSSLFCSAATLFLALVNDTKRKYAKLAAHAARCCSLSLA